MEELQKIKTLYNENRLGGCNPLEAAKGAAEEVLGWNHPYIYRDEYDQSPYIFYNNHVLFFDGDIYSK